jgi:hypothetical protein
MAGNDKTLSEVLVERSSVVPKKRHFSGNPMGHTIRRPESPAPHPSELKFQSNSIGNLPKNEICHFSPSNTLVLGLGESGST